MDMLSEVLSLMKPQSYVSGGYRVVFGSAVQFPRKTGMKCYAVLSGTCWLSVEGFADVQLSPGDCYILPHGLPFRLATDRTKPAVDYATLRVGNQWGNDDAGVNEGDCFLVGGHFVLAGPQAELLLSALLDVIHLKSEQDRAVMVSSLTRMREEVLEASPGSSLIVQQLAFAMLIRALRLYLNEARPTGTGWLFALTDPQLSKALTCFHSDPGRGWTLEELAGSVGMSRSAFALKFKQVVGASPMEYLARWRMLLACDRLMSPGVRVGDLAFSLGYESESAFGKAFKRFMKCSPRQYRRDRQIAAPQSSETLAELS
jgi:AraC-like DNA-binding protein